MNRSDRSLVHSAIHCTYNRVLLQRFAAYLLSSFCLWFLLIRFAWRVW